MIIIFRGPGACTGEIYIQEALSTILYNGVDTISNNMIRKALDEIESVPEDEIAQLSEQFGEEQPYLMTYLVAVCENSGFEPEEQEMFFFIGLVLWRVTRSQGYGQSVISERDMDAVTSANDAMLSSMKDGDPDDFLTAVTAIADEYAEPALLKFIIESIFVSEEENGLPPITEENSGTAFYHLKIALDALIR